MQRKASQCVFAIAVVCVIAALSGCSPWYKPPPSVSKKNVIGTYKVKYEPYAGVYLGEETLVLKSNRTFVQLFKPKKGHLEKNQGTWKLHREPDGRPSLDLNGIMAYLNEGYDKLAIPPTKINMTTGFMGSKNRPMILINDDMGLYYEKIK